MSARHEPREVDHGPSLRAVCGLDWASQPPGRAAAVLSTYNDTLCLESIVLGLSDSAASQFCREAAFAAVGVDVPFGWPSEFTRFVTGWQANGGAIAPPEGEAFRYRVTDRVVRDRLGKHPLSVSSDLISLAARSWVALVHQFRLGPQVDFGLPDRPCAVPPIIEVYPGAALVAFCGARPAIRSDGYKKDASVRRKLLEALAAEFRLDLGGNEDAVIGSGLRCDAFDALVAALTTAIYAGLVSGWTICQPGRGFDLSTLRQEGWIYFPIPDPETGSAEPDVFAASTRAAGNLPVPAPRSKPTLVLPSSTPVPTQVQTPALDPVGLLAADVVNQRVLCPACRNYVFQRWPSGWDAHSHRCPGLTASTHVDRKAEFKSLFRHLFR